MTLEEYTPKDYTILKDFVYKRLHLLPDTDALEVLYNQHKKGAYLKNCRKILILFRKVLL